MEEPHSSPLATRFYDGWAWGPGSPGIGLTQAIQSLGFAPASATPFACATELRVRVICAPLASVPNSHPLCSHLLSVPISHPLRTGLSYSVCLRNGAAGPPASASSARRWLRVQTPTSPISRPPLPDLGPGLSLGYAREMRNGRTALLTSHNRDDINFAWFG